MYFLSTSPPPSPPPRESCANVLQHFWYIRVTLGFGAAVQSPPRRSAIMFEPFLSSLSSRSAPPSAFTFDKLQELGFLGVLPWRPTGR